MDNLELLKKANTLVEEEKFKEAEKAFDELLKNVDDNSKEALDAYFSYANFKGLAGASDYEKSIEYAAKAYKLCKKLYKENSDNELLLKQAEIADFLGDSYRDFDMDKMSKCYKDAIKIWNKNIDKNKDYMAFIACDALDVANYAEDNENEKDAYKYYNLAYRIWNKYLKLGPSDEYEVDGITKDVYKALADYNYEDLTDKSAMLYKKVIKICEKYMDTDKFPFYGSDYVDSLYKLSEFYYDEETYDKSLKYSKKLAEYLKDTEDEDYLEILIEQVKRLEQYYDEISDYDKAKKYAVKFFNYAKRQYDLNEEKILDYADASYNMIFYSDAIKYKALALGLAYDMDPEGETEYYHDRFMDMAKMADNIEEEADIWLDMYDYHYSKKFKRFKKAHAQK